LTSFPVLIDLTGLKRQNLTLKKMFTKKTKIVINMKQNIKFLIDFTKDIF
jgi:hypothetical protein